MKNDPQKAAAELESKLLSLGAGDKYSQWCRERYLDYLSAPEFVRSVGLNGERKASWTPSRGSLASYSYRHRGLKVVEYFAYRDWPSPSLRALYVTVRLKDGSKRKYKTKYGARMALQIHGK
jgi:hypothetical protein